MVNDIVKDLEGDIVKAHDALKKELAKDGEISDDDSAAGLKKMQASVDKGIAKVDEIVTKKEAEIMEV